MTRIRIGISVWLCTLWREVFYPKELPQRLELHYASRILRTIDNTDVKLRAPADAQALMRKLKL